MHMFAKTLDSAGPPGNEKEKKRAPRYRTNRFHDLMLENLSSRGIGCHSALLNICKDGCNTATAAERRKRKEKSNPEDWRVELNIDNIEYQLHATYRIHRCHPRTVRRGN